MKRTILLLVSAAFACISLSAQEGGYVTGSFETTDHFYFDDEKIYNDFLEGKKIN